MFWTRNRLMSERLWQTALADHCINKPLKNLRWSYWRLIWRQNCFDMYNWTLGSSEKFHFEQFEIKVAPYPMIVSLDTLTCPWSATGFQTKGKKQSLYRYLREVTDSVLNLLITGQFLWHHALPNTKWTRSKLPNIGVTNLSSSIWIPTLPFNSNTALFSRPEMANGPWERGAHTSDISWFEQSLWSGLDPWSHI